MQRDLPSSSLIRTLTSCGAIVTSGFSFASTKWIRKISTNGSWTLSLIIGMKTLSCVELGVNVNSEVVVV